MNSKGRCKHCKATIPRKEGVTIGLSLFCNYGCYASFVKHEKNKAMLKALAEIKSPERVKQAKKNQAQTDKDQLTSRKLKPKVQEVCNKYIRLRDTGKSCVSCGKPYAEMIAESEWKLGGSFDAGHWISRGANESLRFNTNNIHLQCKPCNSATKYNKKREQSVNEYYKQEIINRLGEERVQAIIVEGREVKKWSVDYLLRMKEVFKKLVKREQKRLGV